MNPDNRDEGAANINTMIEEHIKRQVPLSSFTTFRVGGRADYFIEATSLDMIRESLDFARTGKIPFILLGGGSNVLIDDGGVRGMVVKNMSMSYRFSGGSIWAESGVSIDRLVEEAGERGFWGIHCFAGIPGTLGGAIYGNAGAYRRSIQDVIVSARILTREGKEIEVEKDYFRFRYRWSSLKETRNIVLSASLRLEPGEPSAIKGEIERIIRERHLKHPRNVGTAGCFFKNVECSEPGGAKLSAGKLLEEIGAKGLQVGGARVSELHSNFIINPGSATSEDIKELAKLLKERVYARFGIRLEEEVQIIGEKI